MFTLWFNRFLWALFCASVVLSLTACGGSTDPAEEIVVNGDTSPQILGIQPKEEYQIAVLFNRDYDVEGGTMVSLTTFGEVSPPTEFVVKTKVDGKNYKSVVTPNIPFFVPTANIDSMFESIEIHADEWKFTRRGDTNIWDGIQK